ncbi:hypothetical protein GCM10007086_44900 [Photobacterium aphoticum]|nr:hypothetical protein GCM10007086_44900 [Photobacterium aphoticum]
MWKTFSHLPFYTQIKILNTGQNPLGKKSYSNPTDVDRAVDISLIKDNKQI